LEVPPLLTKPHDHRRLSRRLGQRVDGLASRLDGDLVVKPSQGVAGQAQLGEDYEVRAPGLGLGYDLFRMAEVFVGVAKDAVNLG